MLSCDEEGGGTEHDSFLAAYADVAALQQLNAARGGAWHGERRVPAAQHKVAHVECREAVGVLLNL